MPQTFIDKARQQLDQLRKQDPHFKVFGASAHKYTLNPVLSETDLGRREQALGIVLPEPYRAFLLSMGNGGAGPAYGVFPFQGKASEDYTKYDQLGQPFAYRDAYNPTELIGSDEDEDEDENPMRPYWEAFDDRGALFICHHGCGARAFLVVSGPARGQVWSDNVADEGGYEPDLDRDGKPHDFASWYLAWLEKALASTAG